MFQWFRSIAVISAAPLVLTACEPMVAQNGVQVVYCTKAPAGYVVPQEKWDPYMVACPPAVVPPKPVRVGGGGSGGNGVIEHHDGHHDGHHGGDEHGGGGHDGDSSDGDHGDVEHVDLTIGASAENGTASLVTTDGTHTTVVSASHGQVSIVTNGVSQTPALR